MTTESSVTKFGGSEVRTAHTGHGFPVGTVETRDRLRNMSQSKLDRQNSEEVSGCTLTHGQENVCRRNND